MLIEFFIAGAAPDTRLTVIKFQKIAGAKEPIAPVLNSPLYLQVEGCGSKVLMLQQDPYRPTPN